MNVSSVKNLNGEVFSAVQDASLTNVVQTNSGNWQDITAYQNASATYLTAHQSLDGYATETLVEETSGAITSLIPTNYYPDTNPSGFISGVDLSDYQTIEGMTAYQPVGDYVQGSDLELNSYNKISAISGHELAGGGGSVEFDYDSNGEISGINSSAISDSRAGTPLYVESPLFTGQSGNSAYIGSDINETVLYSNLTGRPLAVGGELSLSESPLNFEYIEIYLNGSAPSGTTNVANGYEKVPNLQLKTTHSLEFIKAFNANTTTNVVGGIYTMGCGYSGVSSTNWKKTYGYAKGINSTSTDFGNNTHLNIWQIVGINRKRD